MAARTLAPGLDCRFCGHDSSLMNEVHVNTVATSLRCVLCPQTRHSNVPKKTLMPTDTRAIPASIMSRTTILWYIAIL
jgi:transcription elongation factor Elf1